MQHHRQIRPLPNAADPLSEPTPHRRIWAAYIRAGFNRATWAEHCGISYTTADAYDMGRTAIPLVHLIRASEATGYTADDLVFGHARKPSRAGESELSREAIKALLYDLRAGVEATEALAEHERSAAGHFQRFTRSYVAAFIERYDLARREGFDRPQAIEHAMQVAVNARANAEAISLRAHPISAEDLSLMGERLRRGKRTPRTTKKG